MKTVDMIIIGGGSAGMAAALAAKEQGIEDLLILEREEELGGILQQCIHNGFGLQIFHEELTGPSFAQRLIDAVHEAKIAYRLETTVLSITSDRQVIYVNKEEGYVHVQAKTILLACGCYERTRGAIAIPGTRVKGVYTAGTAQKYLNIENLLVGKRVFILGSGDIGLIMARRMTLEGAQVLGVAELMPYSNGLMRNIVQCLNDYEIPLYLSHTVIDIQGRQHVESVTIASVDENQKPIPGTEKSFVVDTLLLSVGLVPETGLAREAGIQIDPKTRSVLVNDHYETTIRGIYACGNALHVHDLVDYVVIESKMAGRFAAMDLKERQQDAFYVEAQPGEGINYVLPQRFNPNSKEDILFSFRVKKPYQDCKVQFLNGETVIKTVQKRYLLPAEMERIKLSKDEISSIRRQLKVKVIEG